MAGDSASFFQLDPRIQRYIWAEGWEALRDAQEAAIPLILPADRDVLVAAATAAGKTEAAFLPALTHLLAQGEGEGSEGDGLIVYVSPLKALINDQFGRLERLCEHLDVPVWPWHGDISATSKARFLARPRGVLLITPESLESLLYRRGTSVAGAFARTTFFVVDELHAFIGSERGKQLQSLLHRVDKAIGRRVPRIGLSATLGDLRLAAGFLRPGGGEAVAIVESSASGAVLKILVKGYEEPVAVHPPPAAGENLDERDPPEPIVPRRIAQHLFENLRGSNNLVFPNTRRDVERYTGLLNDLAEQHGVPNEFWPHHGNLSKELRAETEAALKQQTVPATAVCTNTLELGLDIGAVKSVAQIGAPPTVASLRQRLGRSGRRPGEPAILRGYAIEDAFDREPSLASELRLSTVRQVAMISLLLEGWFEPPRAGGAHYSTLVQQVLSVVAQTGGASIGELYGLLCGAGAPFAEVSKADFAGLVRHLGSLDLLVQDSAGTLLHGGLGEKFVNHYSFCAAFATEEEYRLVSRGRALGTLPVVQVLTPGQRLLFGGKTWVVQEIDEGQKTIHVARAKGGTPPLFGGGPGRVHTRVRQRMRELLASDAEPPYLDAVARRFLAEGRANYQARELDGRVWLDQGLEILLLTWLGDAGNEGLACLLRWRGFKASAGGPGVEIEKGSKSVPEIMDGLAALAECKVPPPEQLLAEAKNLKREKWDWALSEDLLRTTYASLYLDVAEGLAWVRIAMASGTTSLFVLSEAFR